MPVRHVGFLTQVSRAFSAALTAVLKELFSTTTLSDENEQEHHYLFICNHMVTIIFNREISAATTFFAVKHSKGSSLYNIACYQYSIFVLLKIMA